MTPERSRPRSVRTLQRRVRRRQRAGHHGRSRETRLRRHLVPLRTSDDIRPSEARRSTHAAADPRSLNLAISTAGTRPTLLQPHRLPGVDPVAGTAREQRLFQAATRRSVGPRTMLEIDGRPQEVINLARRSITRPQPRPSNREQCAQRCRGMGIGACGVPLLTGTSRAHKQLESIVSTMLDRTDSMLFPSGFSGGVGLMSALLGRGTSPSRRQGAHVLASTASVHQARSSPYSPTATCESSTPLSTGTRPHAGVVVVDGCTRWMETSRICPRSWMCATLMASA